MLGLGQEALGSFGYRKLLEKRLSGRDGWSKGSTARDWDLTAFFPLYSGQSGVGVASILHKFLLFFSHPTSRLRSLGLIAWGAFPLGG